jgi:hypothetical protein
MSQTPNIAKTEAGLVSLLLPNRDFELPADGWYQAAPVGEWLHQSGLVQVIDEAALAAMTRRNQVERGLGNWPGLLVDYDHFSLEAGRASEAAGWATELAARGDGLWAKIRWTDSGEAAVRGGRYRLLSPVFDEVESLGGNRVRPVHLLRLALTNDPNLRGMTPLSNRETERTSMDKVKALLGLAAEAAEDAVLGAVEQLKNRAGELDAANRALSEELAASDLARFEKVIKPEKREEWKAALLRNRKEALALLEGIREQAMTERLHNRAGAATPTGEAWAAAEERAAKQRAAVKERQAQLGCSFDAAWRTTRAEKPALFRDVKD